MLKINEYTYEIEVKDIKDKFAQRPSNSNKGGYGYAGIMGGSLEYSGAIKLANLSASAMRTGCGVVRLIIPEGIAKAVAPYLLEQTIFPMKDENNKMIFSEEQVDEALVKLKALAIGMGWGQSEEYEKILEYILNNYNLPVVIDADGLNTVTKMNMDILKSTKCKVILTPHLKEFERLSKMKIEDIKQDEITIAKDFAKKYDVILLLKGPTTVVTGAYLNGMAGEMAEEKYTDISMIASDTVKCLPDAIKKLEI